MKMLYNELVLYLYNVLLMILFVLDTDLGIVKSTALRQVLVSTYSIL